MKYRSITEQDLPQLVAIENATAPCPWSYGIFQRCLTLYAGWVITPDDAEQTIIGFVFIQITASECHVLNISIHPNYQRAGWGNQLLCHALTAAKAKGASMAYLEVRRSNQPAIQLYQKMGFSELDVRKNYYKITDGYEDALLFAKELNID